jgi:hypothetical protein
MFNWSPKISYKGAMLLVNSVPPPDKWLRLLFASWLMIPLVMLLMNTLEWERAQPQSV